MLPQADERGFVAAHDGPPLVLKHRARSAPRQPPRSGYSYYSARRARVSRAYKGVRWLTAALDILLSRAPKISLTDTRPVLLKGLLSVLVESPRLRVRSRARFFQRLFGKGQADILLLWNWRPPRLD